MKICIDARVIINHQTGLGNYTYNLIKSLLSIDQENSYLIFIGSSLRKDHPIHLLEQKNLIKKILNIPPVSIVQHALLPIELIKENPDIYHYPNWDIPLFHPIKSIFTVHDLTYLLLNDAYLKHKWIKRSYTKLNILWGLKKAKKIIAVSESTKKDLLNHFQVVPNKINVVYEACEDIFDSDNLTNSTMKYPHEPEKEFKYFLCVAETRPHKNLVRTIQAFNLFREQHKGYKLIITGKPYSSYLEPQKIVDQLNLKDDVLFYGYVETNKLVRLYQNAEALLFVSLYEGFGLPILEAMSCRTAVITSNLSATNEIAGDAAIKVNPYDVNAISEAMNRIVEDKTLKDSLILKGLERKRHFSWLKAAEQTLAVYEAAYNN
ncbi:MAG: glycosyltransferase family 4 protein [candidate division KSB1 bacterium]|nr:glycosyltransferase family 4 protein [candidate division KSB1 bacterium]MDZ7334588.1 glycosyltransferase family 4 protein [candidate division KSB1 bacterium]MDZ7399922.1 glycosyltransferase family 4 protein [candidate division KSB1 bacterium]